MEAVAEGLWTLAEQFGENGCIAQAVKCLEAICQADVPFLPIIEVKTRLQIATILMEHTDNLMHAKAHLERALLLLKQMPAYFELKCRAYSLLSQCYHLLGTIPPQKQTLKKGLELATSAGNGESGHLWTCNFSLQLANALAVEGDFSNVIRVLESGLTSAAKTSKPELEMVFASSMLHVHLMRYDDAAVLNKAIERCSAIWDRVSPQQRTTHVGLIVYNELLHIFYFLRACDYKEASRRINLLEEILGKFSNEDVSKAGCPNSSTTFAAARRSIDREKLQLGPLPLNGDWLPMGQVHILVDLMATVCARPKGNFKECAKRLASGLQRVEEELLKLGITDSTTERDLQHWSIWMAGVYLMLIFQLLENKVAIELTRTDFVEAQQTLVRAVKVCARFPLILQGCESPSQLLLGHYAHSVGCFREAALHYMEGAKLAESRSLQAMCQVYAAISYICMGDTDSSSQALDLIDPVYKAMDTYVGVREKTLVQFASGCLQMKQQNLQEARIRLANGLTLTNKRLGNYQLVSQYLTVLGSLALAMHDTGQARDILKSSLTLAKALRDVPTQIAVLSELTALYHELGESTKELENAGYETRKFEELRKHIESARSSEHHMYLLQYGISVS